MPCCHLPGWPCRPVAISHQHPKAVGCIGETWKVAKVAKAAEAKTPFQSRRSTASQTPEHAPLPSRAFAASNKELDTLVIAVEHPHRFRKSEFTRTVLFTLLLCSLQLNFAFSLRYCSLQLNFAFYPVALLFTRQPCLFAMFVTLLFAAYTRCHAAGWPSRRVDGSPSNPRCLGDFPRPRSHLNKAGTTRIARSVIVAK